jgi:hypothetical protein
VTVIELQPRTGDTVVPTPVILSETPTHVVVAVAISKVELARHRRFIEMLLQAAAAPGVTADDDE